MVFPFYRQHEKKDCGAACLRMICKYYGRTYSLSFLRNKCEVSKHGTSLLSISQAAESIGFRTLSAEVSFEELRTQNLFPCIAHWDGNHYVVLYKISKQSIWVADPRDSLKKYSQSEFLKHWLVRGNSIQKKGVVLVLEPNDQLANSDQVVPNKAVSFASVAKHFLKYKKFLFQLFVGLLIGTLLQLVLPFLTQSIVDIGISTKNISFITLVLVGQVMIFLGSTVVDFLRNWILLHISTRINISMLTQFFIKIMKLPMSYFDSRQVGETIQRIGDYGRVQNFLTGNVITFAYSLINLFVYAIIIIFYDINFFVVFAIGSISYIVWIRLFLGIRKSIDYRRFGYSSKNQSVTIQLVQGMQDIKLSNSEVSKRWEWERLQVKLFHLSIKALNINQIQQTGAFFINQTKNVVLTFLAARAVIDGSLTLGGMMAIQFIIGQLNGPVQEMIQFIRSYQDAKISLERINEVHTLEDEEEEDKMLLNVLPTKKSIEIRNLCFQYAGKEKLTVLENINFVIPEGRTTAIVGMSGSGKTTLLKLLLRFYEPLSGEILIGDAKLSNLSHATWRSRCGVVMQDGFIFSDTILNNIALGDEEPDFLKAQHAAKVANIGEFIESLPLSYNTVIGSEGMGLSQGQKQRILIARAVYKEPDFVFFDEATNALDSNNEKIIMNNFYNFFRGKTVVIVAHRLSTIRHADQIIILDGGKIVEAGMHDELIELKGNYFKLVKSQLDMEV